MDFSTRSTGCNEADPCAVRGGWKASPTTQRKRWVPGRQGTHRRGPGGEAELAGLGVSCDHAALLTDTLAFSVCKGDWFVQPGTVLSQV